MGRKLQALKETNTEPKAVFVTIYNCYGEYLRKFSLWLGKPKFPKVTLPEFMVPRLPELDDSDILCFSGIIFYLAIVCLPPIVLTFYIGIIAWTLYFITLPFGYAVFKWFMKASEKLY